VKSARLKTESQTKKKYRKTSQYCSVWVCGQDADMQKSRKVGSTLLDLIKIEEIGSSNVIDVI
jgi:hypothetical protein